MTTYTTRQINREYKIKVFGMVDGKKVNTLVGVDGYKKIVADDELAMRLVNRVFDKMADKVICKLRRGIKITFYAY